MHRQFLAFVLCVLSGFILLPNRVPAATSFYEGKAVRIIVGFSPGGGYDVYARVLSRHLGKYIPGNPTVIVDNMPGAGSLISANYTYRQAKPDGLTIGHFNGGLILNQVMGQPGVEFDARKFIYLGVMTRDDMVVGLTKASGVTSIDKWMASSRPIKLGGVLPGAFTDNCIRIFKVALGLPIQLISGFKGTADIRMAAESGELDGGVWGWNNMRSDWRNALETGDVTVVLQAIPKAHPELPKVPLAIDLAKTDDAKQLIEVGIHSYSIFARPFVLPPGTPKEREQVLRKAFAETLADKEFLAEMYKAKLELSPISGEELERYVGNVFKLKPALLAKMKQIIFE